MSTAAVVLANRVCCNTTRPLLIVSLLFRAFHVTEICSKFQTFGEDWHDATQVARAFSIGKAEATAISNLQEKISKPIVGLLKEATRCRGMRTWMNHEVLSKDLFNVGFSSGQSGALCAWHIDLSNNQDDVLEA